VLLFLATVLGFCCFTELTEKKNCTGPWKAVRVGSLSVLLSVPTTTPTDNKPTPTHTVMSAPTNRSSALSELETEAQRWASEQAGATELHGFVGAAAVRALCDDVDVQPEQSGSTDGATPQREGKKHSARALADTAPLVVAASAESARPDQGNRLPAHEYLDRDAVLLAKVRTAVSLLEHSKHIAIYAGAGLSCAAGIADYASKASHSVASSSSSSSTEVNEEEEEMPKRRLHPLDARPTYSHCVLAALQKRAAPQSSFSFIQQNRMCVCVCVCCIGVDGHGTLPITNFVSQSTLAKCSITHLLTRSLSLSLSLYSSQTTASRRRPTFHKSA
jgi:hypothetical protein